MSDLYAEHVRTECRCSCNPMCGCECHKPKPWLPPEDVDMLRTLIRKIQNNAVGDEWADTLYAVLAKLEAHHGKP